MAAIDYEVEYNNRARVPEHPAILARWQRDAAAYRAVHGNSELGLAYGNSERQKIDLFWPGAARAARIVLFIHGGYWRALEREGFSHMAAGANERGLAFAAVGYDLCPKVMISEIIEQIREAAAFLGRRHGGPIVACGHSAGGHLAGCLVATDWKKRGVDLPADLTPTGLSISGLFDLTPLLQTNMNADLRLDVAEVRRSSPIFWPVPPGARAFDAWVGADESSEFLRQSRIIADAWKEKGLATRYQAVAGANHFTVLDPLTRPDSPLTARLVELAQL
jgi:arylformamidase